MTIKRIVDEQALIAKANVLIEALPWLMDYAGKTVVIKYGGNAMIDGALKLAFARDIVFLCVPWWSMVVVPRSTRCWIACTSLPSSAVDYE